MTEIVESTKDIEADRIATLDLGGTLVENGDKKSTFYEINTALGLDGAKDSRIFQNHTNDDNQIINYSDHAEDLTKAIRNANIDSTDLEAVTAEINELVEDREVIDYAEAFVSDLHDLGYQTIVLSSAPTAVTSHFANDLGIQMVYRMRDYQFTGNEFKDIYVSDEAELGKQQVIEALQEQGAEVYHFGNGGNDVKAGEVADGGLKQSSWTKKPKKAYRDAIREVV